MKSNKSSLFFLGSFLIAAILTGCSGGSGSSTPPAPVKLVSIAVAPAEATIPTGTTQQYTAIGTYTDNSQSNLTPSVVWSSSSPDVATINTSGLASTPTDPILTASTSTTLIIATYGNISGSAILTVTGGTGTTPTNVMTITVNGSLCDSTNTNSVGYINKPCVSVTICAPGSTTACQTVNDILLDTGSYGLRIFKQAITNVPLSSFPSVTSSSGQPIANCVQFADGSADWGPVQLADVILGNEPAVTVPIQVIDSTFSAPTPTSCGTPQTDPQHAGLNGVLGVGVFAQDCGAGCAPDPRNPSAANNGIYFSCSGTTCTGAAVPLANQVSNPIISLPTDSNGVIVQLPSVPSDGAQSVNGILVLGIGTRSNNTPPQGITTYSADPNTGEILTVSGGTSFNSIVDSGSNGLFFTPPSGVSLPDCGGSNAGWFCPSLLTSLSAANQGYRGTPSQNVMFQVGNFNNLTSGSNMVFSDIGGGIPAIADIFDWGLPFYFGRSIFVGIEGHSSNIGTGTYFAY